MMSGCKSLKKKKGIEGKRKEKESGEWKKGKKLKNRGEKGENAKGKREKVIMCLLSEERSYI